jgi:hypothetical protein
MVTLITSFKGYSEGELTGRKDGNKFEIRLTSGYTLWLYEDEFLR